MNQFFYNKLGKKEKPFFYTYCILVCISGFFLSSLDVIVHVKFFQNFGYKYLSTAYILSGGIGVILTYIYSILYKHLSIKKFFFSVLTFLILLSATFYIFHFYSGSRFVYFVGMVILFPVNALFLLILWRFGRKLLTQAKTRIYFPKIRFYYLVGIALGAAIFTVGLYLVKFEVLVYLSFFSLVILWPLQVVLLLSHSGSGILIKEQEKYIPVKQNMFMYFTSKYTLLLFTFAFLSALVGFTIHFTFVNVSWVAFRSVYGMAKFYGLFIATAAIFIYGIDRFLIKRILYSYDSPYSLVLVSLLFVIAIALIIAANLIAGTNQQLLDGFSVFFILIAILKITYFSLSFTVQSFSLRTLFHSLDLRYKQIAYPRVEGTIVMAGLMFAGGLLLPMTFIKFFSLPLILILALLISAAWFWTGIKLIKAYKKALNDEIAKMRFRKTSFHLNRRFEEQLSEFFSGKDEDKIITSMEISKIFQPFIFERDLIRLLAHPSSKIKEYVLKNIEKGCVYEALPELYKTRKYLGQPLKNRFLEVIKSIQKKQDVVVETDKIPEKLYSPDDEVRENLLQAVINSKQEGKEGVFIILSKDTNIKIQNRAIKNLARIGTGNYNYSLIDFLYPNQYNPYAFEAIASTKDKAIEILERESMLPGTDNIVQSRIIRLYGKIGTPRAIDKLLRTLEYSDTYLINHSVEALYENRFQANQKDKFKIISYFVKVMNILAHNLNTYNLLLKYKKADLLCNAYLLEAEANTHNLFKLLSLIYNPNIISSIQEKFLNGSRAEISHAIELTDEYIDEDIKPLFLTIVEDISLTDKLKRLDYYFPQRKEKLMDIITSTITYDFNSLNIYTRTCALILLDYLDIPGFEDEIIFCTSHPETILADTASFLYEKRRKKNDLKNKRKRSPSSKPIGKFILSEGYQSLLFFKYFKLKQFEVFSSLTEHVTIELAKSSKEIMISKGDIISIDKLKGEYALLLTEALISDNTSGNNLDIGHRFVLFDYLTIKGIKQILCKEKGSVWLFEKQLVTKLLYDNIELTNVLINSLEHLKIVS